MDGNHDPLTMLYKNNDDVSQAISIPDDASVFIFTVVKTPFAYFRTFMEKLGYERGNTDGVIQWFGNKFVQMVFGARDAYHDSIHCIVKGKGIKIGPFSMNAIPLVIDFDNHGKKMRAAGEGEYEIS